MTKTKLIITAQAADHIAIPRSESTRSSGIGCYDFRGPDIESSALLGYHMVKILAELLVPLLIS